MSVDEEFLRWADGKGVKLNGVTAKVLPGRGIGVVSNRKIRDHDVILKVPMRALRTIDTVPKRITDALSGVTVHGILAAEIALDETSDFAVWRTVLPTKEDFEASMPLMWPKELQSLLPKRAKDLLDNQLAGLRKQCDTVLKAFPNISRDEYQYSWLLVNTRTFYNKMQKMQIYPPEERLVCMPVADLFNHADSGCQLSFSPHEGYSVTANREYAAGDEVYVSYGAHSNDFLLTEYGFILDTNRWDDVYLDDVILPKLNRAQRDDLEQVQMLGRYTLDPNTLGCYRTQVALRRICCREGPWNNFLAGFDDGARSQGDVDELLASALREYQEIIRKALDKIEKLDVGLESQRELLSRRWRQIDIIVKEAIEQLW
ncbi:Fc.00g036050.m01.CDS01 [Cosmosporella sp. VM-42]